MSLIQTQISFAHDGQEAANAESSRGRDDFQDTASENVAGKRLRDFTGAGRSRPTQSGFQKSNGRAFEGNQTAVAFKRANDPLQL